MMFRPLQETVKLAVLVLALTGNTFGQAAGNYSGPPQPPIGTHWDLVWSDDFDGTALDLTKWNLPGDDVPRGPGMWTNSQIEVGHGCLQFKVDRVDGKVTSAAITSENKLEVTEGYFEIRAMLPHTPGYRPAFWISSKDINNIDDPQHPTEIDVMEDPGRKGYVEVNLHWNGYGPAEGSVGSLSKVNTPPNEWHTYGVWWNSDGYHFYVDRVPVWFSAGGGVSQVPEFIRLGNEILSDEMVLADNIPTVPFPANDNFTVDYVRVYQLK